MGEKPSDHNAPAKTDATEHDVVLLHGRTKDGQGVRALRSRPDRLEMAEIRPVQKGKPLHSGEIVRLKPRKESPLLCDVDVQYAHQSETSDAGSHPGPPQVATQAYRRNWDHTFGNN